MLLISVTYIWISFESRFILLRTWKLAVQWISQGEKLFSSHLDVCDGVTAVAM